jgi:hypothetical protein
MTRPITYRQQKIANRHQTEAAAMDAHAEASRGPGARVSQLVNDLDILLGDAEYKAFRQELTGLDLSERLAVCKKWMSLLLLVDATERRSRALPGNPNGIACYKFHQAVEIARVCGWVVVTLPYSHKVEMVYWPESEE